MKRRGMSKTKFLLFPVLLFAGIQTQVLAQEVNPPLGEQIYLNTCATGYCHTPGGGAGGGAARLAARGFDLDYITRTVSLGLHETLMQGFASILPAPELQAVIAYVASLNGLSVADAAATAPATPAVVLSPAEERGKALLHDALRGFGRCATCHQVEGSGVPVADPIAVVPGSVRALKRLRTPKVATVHLDRERMPGLVLNQGAARTLFYDLTSAPPVRRNVETGSVTIKPGSRWRHASFIPTYTDAELENILEYLRVVSD